MRRLLPLVGLALALAACGDSGSTTSAAVSAATTATTEAAQPVTEAPPATEAPPTSPPVEVPQRIVSLSATHTEMLYAIGAEGQIAATDITSDYPPAALETAKVDAFNFDVEEVAALDPDLVVLAFDFAGEVAALEAITVPTLLLPPPATLEEAYDQVLALGDAVGRADEAAALVGVMRQEIDELIDVTVAGGAPGSVFHEVDNTLFSANSATFLGDIYSRFGFENIADAVPDEFGSGFVQLSPEYVLDSDPDFIFLADASFGETPDSVAARPGWSELTAVQQGTVFPLEGDVAGRWGPRTVDLVRQIAEGVTQSRSG